MRTKYIVGEIQTLVGTVTAALTFPEWGDHRQMARNNFVNGEARSAGFFSVIEQEGHPLKVSTYGESTSLKLKPVAGDEVLIARSIGIHPDCY